MAVTTAALTIGLSVALAGVAGQRAKDQVEADVGNALSTMARTMVDMLDRAMWARSGEVALLADLMPPAAADAGALRGVIEGFKARFPSVAWMGVTDPAGKVLAATGGILEGVDISHRPVYREGLNGLFVGDVHDAVLLAKLLPNPTGEPMKFVDVSTSLRNRDGSLAGVLAVHLSWTWVREIEQTILAPLRDRDSVQAMVVAADGTVLLGPPERMGHPLDLDSVRAARDGGHGWRVETWPDGRAYVAGYAFGHGHLDYRGLGWSVVVGKRLETAYAAAAAVRGQILWCGGGFALLFSVIGWFAAARLAAPLARISDAAARLRRGERGAALPYIAGTTEIESLSDSLRELVRSLTESRAALARMEDIAYQDRLTGLPNRRFVDSFLQAKAGEVRIRGGGLELLYLDLDGFKAVNDTLGHAAGDTVLRKTALRTASCLRGDDIVARMGGDEFVVILVTTAGGGRPDLGEIAQRLIDAVREPMVIDGTSVQVGCSIGVACFPADSENVDQVLQMADDALYAAKRTGKNRAVTHRDMSAGCSAL